MKALLSIVRFMVVTLPALILTGVVAGARSIADVSGGGDSARWPAKKMTELGNDVFVICNARGPYRAAARPDKPFIVVTLYRLNSDEFFDVLLSLLPGQRQNLLDYYHNDGDDVFGPVTVGKVDVGQPNPMWQFVECEYNGTIPDGLHDGALAGPPPEDEIPF